MLLYFPFSDRNYQPARGGMLHHYDGMEGFDETSFKESAEKMLEMGYSWDLISDKQIQQLQFVNGKIKAPGGELSNNCFKWRKVFTISYIQEISCTWQSRVLQLFFMMVFLLLVPGLSDIEDQAKTI